MGFPANTDTGLTVEIVEKLAGDGSAGSERFVAADGLVYRRAGDNAHQLTLVYGQEGVVSPASSEETVTESGETVGEAQEAAEEVVEPAESESVSEETAAGESQVVREDGDEPNVAPEQPGEAWPGDYA